MDERTFHFGLRATVVQNVRIRAYLLVEGALDGTGVGLLIDLVLHRASTLLSGLYGNLATTDVYRYHQNRSLYRYQLRTLSRVKLFK